MTDRPKTDAVYVGVLSGVDPSRGDWWSFSIKEDGKQYPKKADTKKKDVKDAAMALMGQRVKIAVTEQDSEKINENTGNPFKNRYLNHIAAASDDDVSSQPSGQPAQNNTSSGGSQAQGPSETVRELRIMRMGASERAVAMYASGMLGDASSINDLVETAEAWVAYYVYGAARFGVPAFDSGIAHGEQQHLDNQDQQQTIGDGHEPPPHSDDDIPF